MKRRPTAHVTSIHPIAETPFRSFWMGGYEGADHVNSHGMALDLRRSNGHAARLDKDYAALAPFGIRTVRESIGWRASTDARGRLDLGAALHTARCARRHGLQVVWTLHHYGLPPGVDFFAEDFAARFAGFCEAVARALQREGETAPVYQPINEISALLSGGQVTNPSFVPTQGQSMPTVDYAGLVGQKYQNDLAAYQQ